MLMLVLEKVFLTAFGHHSHVLSYITLVAESSTTSSCHYLFFPLFPFSLYAVWSAPTDRSGWAFRPLGGIRNEFGDDVRNSYVSNIILIAKSAHVPMVGMDRPLYLAFNASKSRPGKYDRLEQKCRGQFFYKGAYLNPASLQSMSKIFRDSVKNVWINFQWSDKIHICISPDPSQNTRNKSTQPCIWTSMMGGT